MITIIQDKSVFYLFRENVKYICHNRLEKKAYIGYVDGSKDVLLDVKEILFKIN